VLLDMTLSATRPRNRIPVLLMASIKLNKLA
jgi:hypothetical protein